MASSSAPRSGIPSACVSSSPSPIREVIPTSVHQRVPVFLGSPEDVEEYIARTAVWQTRRRATFAKDTLEMYRKNAHRKLQGGHSHAARRQAGGDGHGDGGGLFSAQTGDGGGESSMKQRRGRVSVSG